MLYDILNILLLLLSSLDLLFLDCERKGNTALEQQKYELPVNSF